MTEEIPLGTGGAIRNAAEALTCGPGRSGVGAQRRHPLRSRHRRPGRACTCARRAAVTLHLTEVDDPSRFGCVPTDEDGRVTAFLEKTPNPVTNRINAGCYVFTRSVIDPIPAGQVVSVERETFPGLIKAGALVLGYADRLLLARRGHARGVRPGLPGPGRWAASPRPPLPGPSR